MRITGSRIAVFGGGALGLLVGLRLTQRGYEVTVLEREPIAGGLAAGFEVEPGMWLEKFYHHLFKSDTSARAVIEELGLGSRLDWMRPRTVVLRDGVLHQLDSPSSLLAFRPISLAARTRMSLALAYLKLSGAPRHEGREAASWLRSTMGREAFEVVWEPLLKGKFGGAYDQIALTWFWARIHDRTTELGYLAGGFQQLYDGLCEQVRRTNGRVLLGAEATGIESRGDELVVSWRTSEGQSRESFQAVVSTLPTRITGRLADLPTSYTEKYGSVGALGAHCLLLALDRPLTDAYWININDPRFPFLAVVEHTNFRSPSEYGGRHLVYFGNYRPMDDPLFKLGRQAVLDEFLPHVKRMNPAFATSWVTDSWVAKAPFAQPIVTVDYRSRIPPFETPMRRLFTANMFQVYPHDRGQNYSFELAERLVARHFPGAEIS